MELRDQARDPSAPRTAAKGKDGDSHKLPTPSTPDPKVRGIKLEPVHGKPKDLAQSNAAGRNCRDTYITKAECKHKQLKNTGKPCGSTHW